ncbi:Ion channel [Mucilaginibacter pineti]|uniref:Ion channel n=1 Tax=Mucilaginibacter pineti TaxID=1391627 RepID=A0A1G6ZHK6_9SPHI|nr:potassium channel family protein [Mucilaginibacter pineti]SDE01747.1 Ion channel [Mucilaginibacter pineti]
MTKFNIFGYEVHLNKLKKSPTKKQRPVKEKAKLITGFGKLIERTPFWLIVVLILLLIFGSALYYLQAGVIFSNGNPASLKFGDAVYFSVVTFTSLGYGEYVPVGFARTFAASEVLLGLILVSMFVAKLASERQSALLLLVYTSQQQERIDGFEHSLTELRLKIDRATKSPKNKELRDLSESTLGFCSVIRSYLIVHYIQGDMARYGNGPTLLRLYRSFYDLQKKCFEVLKIYDLSDKNYAMYGNIIGVCAGIARRLIRYHKNGSNEANMLNNMEGFSRTLTNWQNDVKAGTVMNNPPNKFSDEMFAKVKKLLSNEPWTDNKHKTIAIELNISNKLAEKYVNKLIELGEFDPKIEE